MTACAIHPDAIPGDFGCTACVRLETIKARLLDRTPKHEDAPGCFLCKWILLDLTANKGRLKGWNLDMFGQPIFPKKAELAHLRLEEILFVESEL